MESVKEELEQLLYMEEAVLHSEDVPGIVNVIVESSSNIAAAPDLLEALEDCLATHTDYKATLTDAVGIENMDRKINAAQKAIAKAKGQS